MNVKPSEQNLRRVESNATRVVAKIVKPTTSGAYVRERLNRLLEESAKFPIVWISAPAGAGKTTAVVDYLNTTRSRALWYQIDSSDNDVASFFYYLGVAAHDLAPDQTRLPLFTAEYRAGRAAFAARFFQELFAKSLHPGALVLDDFQELDSVATERDSPLYEVLSLAFQQLTGATKMIFISRENPPPAFARLRANNQLKLIDWEALRLTEEESVAIVNLRCASTRRERADILRLHRETQGWVTGLLLLAEQTTHASETQAPKWREEQKSSLTQGRSLQLVFDYFAYELFRRMDRADQLFMLRTALFPNFNAKMAGAMATSADPESTLWNFARGNRFTLRLAEGQYAYHPLLRAFLLNRFEQEFDEPARGEIRRQSAQLLAEQGNFEAAMELLLQTEEWSNVVALVLVRAPQLIAEGRTETLAQWLKRLPDELLCREPWLSYWLGVCQMHTSPGTARESLRRAFEEFERGDDASPLIRCWCAIVDSFVVEWKDFAGLGYWLDRFGSLTLNRRPASQDVAAASVLSYLSGLLWGRPDHPDLRTYVELADSMYRREPNNERRLALAVIRLLPCYVWAGDLGKFKDICRSLSERPPNAAAEPVVRLNWYVARSVLEAITGAAENAFGSVNEALSIADRSGIHIFDGQLCGFGVWGHVSVGNPHAARALLDRMSGCIGSADQESYFRHFSTLVLLQEKQVRRAVEEARRALELSKYYIGDVSCGFALAGAYLLAREFDSAASALRKARELASAMHSDFFIAIGHFMDAILCLRRGEVSPVLRSLNPFLDASRAFGIVVPAYALREDAVELLTYALAQNFRVTEVKELIIRTRLSPPTRTLNVHWPWPLKLFTLGRFMIVKNDAPLMDTGKSQKKPLELLRMLVAFGGRDVAIGRLAHALWPDAEGDVARSTLRTTLLRLRRLIGDEAITQQAGCLSLNAECCWLDIWTLERLCEEADDDLQTANNLFELYLGRFLPADDEPWSIAQRERLRSKALRKSPPAGNDWKRSIGPGRRSIFISAASKSIPSRRNFIAG